MRYNKANALKSYLADCKMQEFHTCTSLKELQNLKTVFITCFLKFFGVQNLFCKKGSGGG
jgi:hypothetical protein